jgi:hypothetical protein
MDYFIQSNKVIKVYLIMLFTLWQNSFTILFLGTFGKLVSFVILLLRSYR